MVWLSPAQGNRPYAPRTGQTVCIVVTPYPENGIFCSLCFQYLTHSFAGVFSTTPLQSYCSTLFAKNTGGGYTPPSLPLVFKRLRTLKNVIWRGYLSTLGGGSTQSGDSSPFIRGSLHFV